MICSTHTAAAMKRQALTLLRGALRAGSSEAAGVNTTTRAAAGLVARRGYADDASLLKTPLFDFHVEHGGERPRRPAMLRPRRPAAR